jgi:hypothetical protein
MRRHFDLVNAFVINVIAELIGSSYVGAISNGNAAFASMMSILYYGSFIATTKVIVMANRKEVVFACILARGLGTWIVVNYCHGG